MSLKKYIRLLSNKTKGDLLGVGVLDILRSTFCTKNNDAIPENILNEAVLIQAAYKIVSERKHRQEIINALSTEQIKNLGFSSFKQAIESLSANAQVFCTKLNIDQQYSKRPTPIAHPPFEKIDIEYNAPLTSVGYLHPYQRRVKATLHKSLTQNTATRHLTVMPTGAGKTTTALEVIVDLLRSNTRFGDAKHFELLWIVDNPVLAEQALLTLKTLWQLKGDKPIYLNRYFTPFESCIEHNDPTATFATFSLITARLDSTDTQRLLKRTSVIIIDEAHSANAPTYRQIFESFRQNNPQGQIIGLTATPYRPDDETFNSVRTLFNSHIGITDENDEVLESPIEFLTQKGYLAYLDFHQIPTGPSEDFSILHAAVMEVCQRIVEDQQNCIIFCKSYPHSIALNLFLRHNDVYTELIVGDTPPEKRNQLLKRLADPKDELNIVVNHDLLGKGVDVKGLKSIMILNDINNASTALQTLGRALRGHKNGGNEVNKVYLTKENFSRLSNFRMLEQHTLNNA